MELVQEILVQRFVNLSRQELSQMLELHDIRESRVVKEIERHAWIFRHFRHN
jgi:predicted transposase YdaD